MRSAGQERGVEGSGEQIVLAMVDAYNRRDLEATLSYLHPQMQWSSAIAAPADGSRVYHGIEGYRTYWEDVFSICEEVEVTFSSVRSAGDAVITMGRVRGRARAGGVIDVPGSWVWKLRDGLIASGRIFTDEAQARAAAGLPPRDEDSAAPTSAA
jgi:ketosteroid isomerase-like protein